MYNDVLRRLLDRKLDRIDDQQYTDWARLVVPVPNAIIQHLVQAPKLRKKMDSGGTWTLTPIKLSLGRRVVSWVLLQS
jgi:hypothetical protein